MPRSSARVAAAVENTIAAIAGPASSSGPCRNCAAWSDSAGKRAASFSVSAPISAAARAPAAREKRQHGAVVQPVGQRLGGGVGARPAAARHRRRAASAPSCDSAPSALATASIRTSVAANVIVDGPCSSPARVSRWTSARAASGLSAPFVTATTVGRGVRSASASATRTVSALRPDWLTHTTSVVGGDGGEAEVEELGGVEHRGGDAGRPERGHRRVAGVVGAPHAGEDDVAPGAHRRQRTGLVEGRLVRSPDRLGLARDLGDESIRKLS